VTSGNGHRQCAKISPDASTMTSCPACGQNIPDGARFCGACGHQTLDVLSRASLVGTTIADRYRVLRVIAEGGMGIVYEAEQPMGEGVRKVALKTLLPELSSDSIVISRFNRECGVVAGLEHPNTVRVYDFGTTEEGTLYIAMEFVRGRSLGDVIAEGPMPLNRCMGIMEQVTSALEEAHNQGIIHRDLKPDNLVLCERAGIHDFAKILDFGIAKRSSEGSKHDTKLTQQGTILGTPPYMSPEQFTGEELDRTSDVYSLGIILYEMLNSRLPFEADNPWQWAHQHLSVDPAPFAVHVSSEVEQVVFGALSKLRSGRPSSAIEFYRLLAVACRTATASASCLNDPGGATPAAFASTPKGVNRSEAPALGMQTEPSMLRPPDVPPTLDEGIDSRLLSASTAPGGPPVPVATPASTGTEPGGLQAGVVDVAVSPTGTVAGTSRFAFGLGQGGSSAARGNDAAVLRPASRRTWGSVAGTLAIVSTVLGAAGGLVWWVRQQRNEFEQPPIPSTASVPVATAEIAAETPLVPVSTGFYGQPTVPLPHSRGAVTPGNPQPAPVASVPQSATSNSTQPQQAPTSTTAPVANPFPFPFPIALPSTWTPAGVPPVVSPTPTPTPAPAPAPTPTPAAPVATASPAPASPAAGMQNCAQATALAATNLDAAIGQYQICEGAVGRTAAGATRSQIVAVGIARVRALAAQGQCDEANRVAQTLARVGAQRPALDAMSKAGCRI
jgi:eukaryotic-like serine/threonine-protein kinase